MSLTDPWRPDSDALIRESCEKPIRAYAVDPVAGRIDLEVLPGSTLTFDETRAPRVTGELVVAPVEVTLDPRAGVRVVVEAGYVRPGGITDVHPMVDLGLRKSRRVTRARRTSLQLSLAGDEQLVIDAAAAVGETITAGSTAAAASQILAATINPAPLIVARTPGPAVSAGPITDRFDTLRDIGERSALAIYDAGLRTWVCELRPTVASESAAILATGANGTVEELDDAIDRADWYNYVLYRYVWRNAAGTEQRVTSTAYASSGAYAITGTAGKRIWREDRTVPTTQADANAATADVLGRLLSRGDTAAVTSVAAWWLRPGMTVTREGARVLVQAVTFDLAVGRMTVVHRSPVTAAIATTTPPALPPAPDPLPPAKAVYQWVWVASASGTYRGDGSKRNDTSNMVQGYYPANGNGQAIALFTGANSSGSEIGKTIAQALTGVPAGDVLKVELELYYEHWQSAAGGSARLGRYIGNTIPASYTSAIALKTIPGWPRGYKQWVDITDITDKPSLIAGNHGCTLGPGIGTDTTYYGRAHGQADPNPPRLRITAQK